MEVHIGAGNYATHKTPAIQAWLAAHPRFTMHFTPTSSSWLNQVERWFRELAAKMMHRSACRSVQALEADIRAWNLERQPQALHVDQDSRRDARNAPAGFSTNFRRRTLATWPRSKLRRAISRLDVRSG
jgi:DDE superfamily endonuclease